MAVTFTYSNRYKYALMKKLLDISADSIKVLLMRSGFVFNKDDHATRLNIKGTIGPVATIAFVDGGAGNDSITDSGAGFVAAGLVAGNSITISGSASNNITVVAISVVAGTIEVATGSLTTEGAGAAVTITADDELVTGGGYTQDTKTTGAVTMASEDDTNDRCDATFPTVTWTAAGTNIGPTPGAILYDDTAAENTIIGYLDFDGEVTTVPPDSLHIGNGTLRLA